MRPEGFEKLLVKHLNLLTERKKGSVIPEFDMDYAEAGADAMLEGLKKAGDYCPAGEWTDDVGAFCPEASGYLVFIPEDE